jgi:hypothetical protein
MICPSYQSAFIFDKPTQREKFVYYNESTNTEKEILASNSNTITLPPRDSTWDKSVVMPGPSLPQVRRVKKDRYLLLPEKTYKKAMRALQTVEMKQILPKKTDSLDIAAALDSAARSVTDTLLATAPPKKKEEEETRYMITKTKEKYNIDESAYLWYFRDVLVMPDVRAAKMNKQGEGGAAPEEKKEAKKGFFKKLFGKKSKTQTTDEPKPDESKSDTTTTTKKKSLNPFKKKSSNASESNSKKKSDAKKKEEEDDGF